MEKSFDGLCSLVNKQGVCYQCSGLRECAAPDRRGDPPPPVETLRHRLQLIKDVDADAGQSQRLHDLFWRRIAEQERAGRGSVEPLSECGLPPLPLP
jgi:RNA polymerase sigma-70 factor (ECF subfamily)